ncbi:MAG TPA: hypothetical protein VEV84_13685 [Pyrinomonadaceae bacterium]|jgi:hypothetical protein|nr:hypothetical protein [Pyrinomonadaceae bacterium]
MKDIPEDAERLTDERLREIAGPAPHQDCETVLRRFYEEQVEIERAMSDEFVRNNTPFPDFEELIIASGCEEPLGDDEIDKEFNEFLGANTKFANWQEMLDAGKAYLQLLEDAALPVN